MAKIGVFGGTFDPIHNGHLVAAEAFAKKLSLSKVLFVPTGNSWQKTTQTAAQDRAEMVRLAIEKHANFELSLIDVNRAGATYTVDTLAEIKELYSDDEIWFILGTDALAGIQTWKDYESIFDLAKVAVITRPGFEIPSNFASRVTVCEIDALDLSSTVIRNRIKNKQSITDLVPVEVANYIEVNNLYEVTA